MQASDFVAERLKHKLCQALVGVCRLNVGLSSFPNNGNRNHYQRQNEHDENKHLEAVVFHFDVFWRPTDRTLQCKSQTIRMNNQELEIENTKHVSRNMIVDHSIIVLSNLAFE